MLHKHLHKTVTTEDNSYNMQKQAKEIEIYGGEAVVYVREGVWQFRKWLHKENKYVRRSLRTKNKETAVEKGEKLCREILYELDKGKTVFSITTKQGVEKYIEHRQKDVDSRFIVKGRLVTIKCHLKHWLQFIGKDVKIRDLDRRCSEQYFNKRRQKHNKVKTSTLKNEQSTINSFWKYMFVEGEVNFESLVFPKLKVNRDVEITRRATFNLDEYRLLIKELRKLVKEEKDEELKLVKEMIRHYILIASNSGMRVGEQRQLTWNDVGIEKVKSKGKIVTLGKVNIRRETTKVRNSRQILIRGGEYIERLRKLSKLNGDNDYLFSVSDGVMLSKRVMYYWWNYLLDAIGIEEERRKYLTYYSLRHFFITQRIMSGVSFRELATICGTSIKQLEETYYHATLQIQKTSILKDYKIDEDGKIVQI